MPLSRKSSRWPNLIKVLALPGLLLGLAAAAAMGPWNRSHEISWTGGERDDAQEQLISVEYEAARRGILAGVPPHALASAIVQMQSMAVPEAGAPAWGFIGPSRIINGQSLLHGGTECAVASRPSVSGRVTSIAIGGNDSVVYLGAAGGGVWKSVNQGLSWDPLTDNLPAHNGIPVAANAIGTLAVVPNTNPAQDIVYAGTGEGNLSCDSEFGQGVLKSTDGGASWTQLGADTLDRLSFTKIAIAPDTADPSNPSVLYAATTNGLISSDTATCVFGTTAPTGLYQSSNRGESWNLVAGLPFGPATDVVVDVSKSFKGPLSASGSDFGCVGSTVATDANQFTITAAPIPNGVVNIQGEFTLTQNPAPNGVCGDFRGKYVCAASIATFDSGTFVIQCLGGPAITANEIDLTGSFARAQFADGSFTATLAVLGFNDGAFGSAPVTLNAVAQNSKPKVYAAIAGSGGGVFKSTDAGLSWTKLTVPAPATRYAMDLDPDGQHLFVARVLPPPVPAPTPPGPTPAATPTPFVATLDAVYSSSDGGTTFVRSGALPAFATAGGKPCFEEKQGSYDLTIADDFQGNVYLGLTGIYQSSDNGKTFAPYLSDPETHADQHAIVPTASGIVYVGNDGGIFSGFDGGGSWSSLNGGLGITQFQSVGLPATGNHLVIGGTQDNGTNIYTGSLGWTHSDDGDGGFALIDSGNSTVMFDEHYYDLTLDYALDFNRSNSSGAFDAWVNVGPKVAAKDPGQFYLPFAADPANPERILLGTKHLWESCQAGAVNCNAVSGNPTGSVFSAVNWTDLSGATDLTGGCTSDFCDITDIAIAPSNDLTVYVVTSASGGIGPHVWISKNSTSASPTFTDVTPVADECQVTGRPITSAAVSPISSGTVMITVSGFQNPTVLGGHVCLSTDFGAHWRDISRTLVNVPVLTGIFDRLLPATTFVVGTDVGVFITYNAGATWAPLNLGTMPVTSVFQLRQNPNIVVAATHGRGAWAIPAVGPPPTATPTSSPTASHTPTATPTATHTPTPIVTHTPGPTHTHTSTPTSSRTSTRSPTPTTVRSSTHTSTPTRTPVRSATRTPARSSTPTAKRTPTPTLSRTSTHSPTPTAMRSSSRTPTPTRTPVGSATRTPTRSPTPTPKRTPTPTPKPTAVRTA